MSATMRVVLTFLLVVLAVALWGASQLPLWYDRAYIGEVERTLAVFLFGLALVVNLMKKRAEPPAHPQPAHPHPAARKPGHAPAAPPRPARRH